MDPTIFREYDIRGLVGRDLTPETVEVLGQGMGTYFRRQGKKDVALGRDCRLSSPSFADAPAGAWARPVAVSSIWVSSPLRFSTSRCIIKKGRRE